MYVGHGLRGFGLVNGFDLARFSADASSGKGVAIKIKAGLVVDALRWVES